MKKKTRRAGFNMLFRKSIDRYCSYCQFAGRIDGERMICQHCGIVPDSHHCRRFRYDPLKRVPPRPRTQPVSVPEDTDFSL